VSSKEYLKEYWQRPEVKEAKRIEMAETRETLEGYQYEHKKHRTLRSRYAHGKYNAKKRKKEHTLTFEEYEVLMNSNCTYCNGSIKDETGIGLDRLDNTKGYIQGNVVPCCKSCNRIRKDSMASEEFKKQTTLNKRRKE